MGKKKNKRGRPTVFSEKVVRIIEKVLSEGGSVTYACLEAGIHIDTFYNWMKKEDDFSEENHRKKYEKFRQRIQIAKETPIKKCRDVIIEVATKKKNRKCAAWFLEKRDPEFRDEKEDANTVGYNVIEIVNATGETINPTNG